MGRAPVHVRNRLIDALAPRDRRLLEGSLSVVALQKREVLFEPGEDVISIHFPTKGVIASLVLNMRDGSAAEAAMIGYEGAVGGVISAGDKPAFSRGIVQIGGEVLRLSTDDLERAKERSPSLRDHFARYADCLLAQVLQSVACNALHDMEARLARWLLTTQDRIDGGADLRVTQEFIAEMLGVQRTYVTRVMGALEEAGAIRTRRAMVTILDRPRLMRQACQCYLYLKRHFQRVLPNVYPDVG
jgi:CRP-like cAMP-binding protein